MSELQGFVRGKIPIAQIQINGRLRTPDLQKVLQIAESIRSVGLMHPLVLSKDYFLLAGNHRLEALKTLGSEEAECLIAPFSYGSPEANLYSVDENLMRKELTVLEQSEYLLMRESLLQKVPRSSQTSLLESDGVAIAETKLSDRALQSRLQIARNLTQDQRDMIRHTGLANQQKELMELARIKHPERRTGVIELLISEEPPATVNEAVRIYRINSGEISPDLDVIKPSNWWAFGRPKWQRTGFAGSIPGEVYANALYYFAPISGVVADGMAGSGMLQRVYNDRKTWQQNRNFELEIRLYDLYPREPFASRYGIVPHNMMRPLPEPVDWLFIDPPYFSIASGLYEGALAQTRDYSHYTALMEQVIDSAQQSIRVGGIFCLFITPYIDIVNLNNAVVDVPADMRNLTLQSGFEQVFRVYVSRGEQQTRGAGIMNIKAKANRRMFSDVCELLVFQRK